ncbi:MAG: adenylyltransferase/cytidyltransferase family protein [Thermoguttaceae bacterium]
MSRVVVSGSFDDFRSTQVRFLQEAAKIGPVHVRLWSDKTVESLEGKTPEFPESERLYFLEALRYVDRVTVCDASAEPDALPAEAVDRSTVWVVDSTQDSDAKRAFCRSSHIEYRVLSEDQLQGFPEDPIDAPESSLSRKKVIVTGCYDWFHSGHVRFFEEVSQLGDLYVVVGHDANIRLLKGEGHPMFSQQERRYMVGAIRHVCRALISSGDGWLDAEPEIDRIKPDIYAVNEDGDRPEKSSFCEAHGIEYRVLRRTPKEGLPRRESTHLRGF